MKKYIIFGDVRGVGGWQLYTCYRHNYLCLNGIDAFVVCRKKVLDNGINIYNKEKTIEMPVLFYPPSVLSEKQINKFLSKLFKKIDYHNDDEVIIECNTFCTSLWGELIAKKTKGKSYAYFLNSFSLEQPVDFQKFVLFKIKNDSISGMSKKTIPDIFGTGKFNCNLKDKTIWLRASWDNPISNFCPVEIRNIIDSCRHKSDFIILYFGSLNKLHFRSLCLELFNYIKANSSYRYSFISLGSSLNNKAESFQKKLFNKLSNCISINIKGRYPVPRYVFDNSDAIFASWGCSSDPARLGLPVARLLSDDSTIVQGITCYTIIKEPYYEQKSYDLSVKDVLDDLLINKTYLKNKCTPLTKRRDYRIDMSLIDEAISSSKQDEYYNTQYIKFPVKRYKLLEFVFKKIGYIAGLILIKIIR